MDREYIERDLADTVGGHLTCKEFVQRVTDYIEASLTFGRWVQCQLHLGVCRGCRNYLKQMKETVQRLGDLQQVPPPEAVRQALQRRFKTWAGSRRGGA